MREQEEGFFSRHRKLFFGFAVVVLLINIILYLLVPQQTTVRYSGTVTEYSLTDSSFAQEHDVCIDGSFMDSILLEDAFDGSFAVSGLKRTERSDRVRLQRDGQLWRVYAQDEAGQPLGTDIAAVRYDREDDIWLIGLQDADHFLAIGVPTRQAGCWRYADSFGLTYRPEA